MSGQVYAKSLRRLYEEAAEAKVVSAFAQIAAQPVHALGGVGCASRSRAHTPWGVLQ